MRFTPMHSIILIDRRSNSAGLKAFLATQSEEFEHLPVLEKGDLLRNKDQCREVRFVFGAWNMPLLSDDQIDECFPALEAIFYAAGDKSYFSKHYESRGIAIYTAANQNSVPVAEFVTAQVLLANKGYFLAEDTYKRWFWRFGFRKARAQSRRKPGNYRATVGLIGLGTVGSLVASKLQPFDLDLVIYDPFVDDEKIDEVNGKRLSLEDLFRTSDVISNHLPNTASTQRLLDDRYFSLMKPEATFINTGRGRQVDERALVRAMRRHRSRSALLDVTSHEPPMPWSALYRTKNIFLSPHIAGSQGNEVERLYQAVYRQYLDHQSKS